MNVRIGKRNISEMRHKIAQYYKDHILDINLNEKIHELHKYFIPYIH